MHHFLRFVNEQGWIIIIGVISVLWVLRKVAVYYSERLLSDGKYILGKHQWRPSTISKPRLCNFCEVVMYGLRSRVVTCDICGMFAHARCAMHTVAKSACKCKQAAVSSISCSKPFQAHHWVKGNIDAMDSCDSCGLFCGSLLALSGLKCSWCQMRVHEKCLKESESLRNGRCDFGLLRKLILPPSSIILRKKTNQNSSSTPRRALRRVKRVAKSAMSHLTLRSNSSADLSTNLKTETNSSPRLRKHASTSAALNPQVVDSSITQPENEARTSDSDENPTENQSPYYILPPPECTPLLVFVNSRSGGQMGLQLLRKLRSWLNPLQVFDLSHSDPISVLHQFNSVPRLKVLVCGGDGTVGWVLGAMDKVTMERQPPVSILPLGTGNDLARVLGWGGGYTAQNMRDLLHEVEKSHVGVLDRWKVDINHQKHMVMNNYFGVGVDAQVALEFHEKREQSPYLFMSQFINKLWYSRFGAQNFLVRRCAGLSKKITVECDGKRISIPQEAEGVIVLNINSYGGGSTLWREDETPLNEFENSIFDDSAFIHSSGNLGPSSHQDRLLDVVAVYGSLHLGQMQVGLSRAVRLCQCSHLKISLQESLPIQIDGEPWNESKSVVEILFHRQSFVLHRTVEEGGIVTTKVEEVLNWAENEHIITASQRDILLAEITKKVKEKDSDGHSLFRKSSSKYIKEDG